MHTQKRRHVEPRPAVPTNRKGNTNFKQPTTMAVLSTPGLEHLEHTTTSWHRRLTATISTPEATQDIKGQSAKPTRQRQSEVLLLQTPNNLSPSKQGKPKPSEIKTKDCPTKQAPQPNQGWHASAKLNQGFWDQPWLLLATACGNDVPKATPEKCKRLLSGCTKA